MASKTRDREFSDEETWLLEKSEDPYDQTRLNKEAELDKNSPAYVCEPWWAWRVATQRYPIVLGKFGPAGISR